MTKPKNKCACSKKKKIKNCCPKNKTSPIITLKKWNKIKRKQKCYRKNWENLKEWKRRFGKN